MWLGISNPFLGLCIFIGICLGCWWATFSSQKSRLLTLSDEWRQTNNDFDNSGVVEMCDWSVRLQYLTNFSQAVWCHLCGMVCDLDWSMGLLFGSSRRTDSQRSLSFPRYLCFFFPWWNLSTCYSWSCKPFHFWQTCGISLCRIPQNLSRILIESSSNPCILKVSLVNPPRITRGIL